MMSEQKKTSFRDYIASNAIPILIEVVFILSCLIVPSSYLIYTNALFYFLLLVYFLISKDLNLKEWFRSFKSGRKYWIKVLLMFLWFVLTFALTRMLEGFFPNFEIGSISLRRDSWLTLIVFVISTIFCQQWLKKHFIEKIWLVLLTRK